MADEPEISKDQVREWLAGGLFGYTFPSINNLPIPAIFAASEERERAEIAHMQAIRDGGQYVRDKQCFPGCACDHCELVRAEHPLYRVDCDGTVTRMEGSEANHPIATQREQTAQRISNATEELTSGRATRDQAVDIKNAAERCIANHDISRSIRRL